VSRALRLVGGLLILAIVAGGGWWLVGGGALAAAPPATSTDSEPSAGRQTAAVERTTLTVTESAGATLGFIGTYEVFGGLSGTLTWTVPVGTVVTAGQRLYETNGKDRTSLMYGTRPAWRALGPDVSNGMDVRQLEQNLKALGYTRSGDKINNDWDARTTAAVKRWQKAAGLPVDGTLDLGEVIFLPEAVRITTIAARLGTMVGQGGPVLSGTSNRNLVSFKLEAEHRSLVEVGKAVQVELPDGSTVPGTIASVSRVADTSTDERGETTSTLTVEITLGDPASAEGLDQAAVTVTIVRASRENVLAVPISALLALREGGYAVEVVEGGSAPAAPSGSPSSGTPTGSAAPTAATHLVKVEPGLFDRGNVEISATGIEPGDLVVVPS
jgi:peptidoglycan hydrolase-like protein with peptidoglycan-binding domain